MFPHRISVILCSTFVSETDGGVCHHHDMANLCDVNTWIIFKTSQSFGIDFEYKSLLNYIIFLNLEVGRICNIKNQKLFSLIYHI